jgi:hypothetical protein
MSEILPPSLERFRENPAYGQKDIAGSWLFLRFLLWVHLFFLSSEYWCHDAINNSQSGQYLSTEGCMQWQAVELQKLEGSWQGQMSYASASAQNPQ